MENQKEKEFWGLTEVMQYLCCGRPYATRVLNMPGCPTLKRIKFGHYKVKASSFKRWVEGGMR